MNRTFRWNDSRRFGAIELVGRELQLIVIRRRFPLLLAQLAAAGLNRCGSDRWSVRQPCGPNRPHETRHYCGEDGAHDDLHFHIRKLGKWI
jgi:hypothetical protein